MLACARQGGKGHANRWMVFFGALVIGILWWLFDRLHEVQAPEEQDSGPTERTFLRLSELAPSTQYLDDFDSTKIKQVVEDCIQAAASATSYSVRSTVRNLAEPKLQSSGYVSLAWRMNFQHPDRFFVTQQMFDPDMGELGDQWVSVGNKNYQNAGFWSDSGRHSSIRA